MWSLRQRENGEFYLTYDRSRWYTGQLRGIWELVGPRGIAATDKAVYINSLFGYHCVSDDEGNVRVLVLE